MELKELEGKKFGELTEEERTFIRDAYLRYFDTCKPRRRALGYCVVLGGIPTSDVGMIDVHFYKPERNLTQYSFKIGKIQIFCKDDSLFEAIKNYIEQDKFLKELAHGNFRDNGSGITVPLFYSKKNRSNFQFTSALHAMMSNTGKDIGFNSKSNRLFHLGVGFVLSNGKEFVSFQEFSRNKNLRQSIQND